VGAAGGGSGWERAGVAGEGSPIGQGFAGDQGRTNEEAVFGDMRVPDAVCG
jgi:hypothetical protein